MQKNRGFTLIEMVVVMVILGILAAVALPKFVNMTGQARVAKMQGAVGAVQSAITLIHAKYLAQGSPSVTSGQTIAYEGGTLSLVVADGDMLNGYPAAGAFGNGGTDPNLAGLDGSFTVTVGTGVVTIADKDTSTCSFTVTNSTGAGSPPVVSTTNLTVANCGG